MTPPQGDPALTHQPISLEAEAADLLEVLRTAGTVDDQGEPYIPVTDAVQFAMNRVQMALDDPLRAVLVPAAPAEGLLRDAQRLLAEVDEWAHGAGEVEGVFARVAGYVNEYLIHFTPADNPLFPDRAALAAAPPPAALDVELLVDVLAGVVIALSDVEHNFREGDGRCVDCGRLGAWDHEDPDCALAGAAIPFHKARAYLAALPEPEAQP